MANITFVFCVTKVTINTLMGSVLMRSLSGVYHSLFKSTFENKIGIINIIVYSSVNNFNQIELIFLQ